MSRYLFVVPPLLGHVRPAGAIADQLTARGHEVAWVGSKLALRPVLGEQATIYKTGSRIHRPQAERGLASVRSLWQEFIVSYTKFIRPSVAKAVADFAPDVIVTDQHAPAGAIIGHRSGTPWAVLACSTIELTLPYRQLPGVEAWLAEQRRRIVTEAGLDPDFEFRFSSCLTLSPTTPGLTGPLALPGPLAQVGPCVGARPDEPDFEWDWLDDRQLVLISAGTLADDLSVGFYTRAIAAVSGMGSELQVIVIADPAQLPTPPPHVRIAPRVPMLELLPRLSAVISHGGWNTVSESLLHGVPLVLAPIRHDQPLNASLVSAAGAGVRVNFARSQPAELQAALTAVLSESTYRNAASAIATECHTAGGATAAAALLEGLSMSSSSEPVSAVGAIR